jgi:photosystem II stability/assembly factor-like uncharacterized protein
MSKNSKNRRRFMVLLAAALAASHLAAAAPRWVPVGPPAAPPVARLFFDPAGGGARAYALTDAGLWRSTSPGSWRSIQAGLDGKTRAFAFDPRHPGRLYVEVAELDGSSSIRRSDDSGDHWSVVLRLAYDTSYYAQELQVDPFAPDTLYWLSDSFLSRSSDGGRTWIFLRYTASFVLSPDQPGTVYALEGGGFSTSVDGGTTWSEPVLIEIYFAAEGMIATRSPRTLYIWARDPGIDRPCFLRSSDGGATWKAYLPQTQCSAPAIDLNHALTVRLVVLSGMGVPQLWKSGDGGETWSVAGDVPAAGDPYVLPGKGLVLTAETGIFRATTDRGPWQPAGHGFTEAEIGAILPTESGLLAARVLPSYAPKPPAIPLLRTADGGRTWSGSNLSNPIALAADPGDPRHVLASAVRYEGWGIVHSRVLESLDGGSTWRGVVDPQVELPWGPFLSLAVDPLDPRTLYAGNQWSGFFRSDDGGRTWNNLDAGLLLGGCHHYYCDTNWVSTIVTDPRRSGSVAILFERQVYVSDDGGSNWKMRGPTKRPRSGAVLALTRDTGGALVAVLAGLDSHDADRLGVVYRSTNEGLTWMPAGRLPPLTQSGRVEEVTAIVASSAGLFAGTSSQGVLRSTNGGGTWTPLNAGLPFPYVSSLVADPSDPKRLYATVPQNGVYTIRVP